MLLQLAKAVPTVAFVAVVLVADNAAPAAAVAAHAAAAEVVAFIDSLADVTLDLLNHFVCSVCMKIPYIKIYVIIVCTIQID